MMRYLNLVVALYLLFVLVPPAAAQAGTSEIAVVEDEAFGSILVDQVGMTLYQSARDEPNVSACYDQCAQIWPPVVLGADGRLPRSRWIYQNDLHDRLSVLARRDGMLQVTYDGAPLYFYSRDDQPGDTNGQGVGGVWSVVSPAEEAVELQDRILREGAGDGASCPLLDSARMTIYGFDRDEPGASNCNDQCARTWPPVLVAPGTPFSAFQARADEGVVVRRDGTMQVTYRGAPLYRYSGDRQPGDRTGEGVGGVWRSVGLPCGR